MNNNNRNHFQQITSNTALPHQNQQVFHQQAHLNASNNLNVDHCNKSYGQTMTVQTQQASLNNDNLSGHVNGQAVQPTNHQIFQGQPKQTHNLHDTHVYQQQSYQLDANRQQYRQSYNQQTIH